MPLLLALASINPALADDSPYLVTPGQIWSNLNIGGEPVRTRSSICRAEQCHLIDDIFIPINQVIKQYDLESFSYEELSKVATTTYEDGRLELPEDIGSLIFTRAKRQELKERQREWRERFIR